MTIWLPKDNAAVWAKATQKSDRIRSTWYMPVRYHLESKPNHVSVDVPDSCVDGAWFHPDRHPDLKKLAKALR